MTAVQLRLKAPLQILVLRCHKWVSLQAGIELGPQSLLSFRLASVLQKRLCLEGLAESRRTLSQLFSQKSLLPFWIPAQKSIEPLFAGVLKLTF